jgi:putative toxin-antitoxin system antitoxin component (TIGR02293 family)
MTDLSTPLKPTPHDTRDLARFRDERQGRGSHPYATLLGERGAFDTLSLLAKVQAGLPYRAIEHLQRNLDLPMNRLAEVVDIRPRTLSRRKEEGRLEPDESDRLLRASRVFGRTLELFEADAATARAWLGRPQRALGGAVPLDLLRTELGAREVEDLIGRLEHGVFA